MLNRKKVLAFSSFLSKYHNILERLFTKILNFCAAATRYGSDAGNLFRRHKTVSRADLAANCY